MDYGLSGKILLNRLMEKAELATRAFHKKSQTFPCILNNRFSVMLRFIRRIPGAINVISQKVTKYTFAVLNRDHTGTARNLYMKRQTHQYLMHVFGPRHIGCCW